MLFPALRSFMVRMKESCQRIETWSKVDANNRLDFLTHACAKLKSASPNQALPLPMLFDWLLIVRLRDDVNAWRRSMRWLCCRIENFDPFKLSQQKTVCEFYLRRCYSKNIPDLSTWLYKSKIQDFEKKDCRPYLTWPLSTWVASDVFSPLAIFL